MYTLLIIIVISCLTLLFLSSRLFNSVLYLKTRQNIVGSRCGYNSIAWSSKTADNEDFSEKLPDGLEINVKKDRWGCYDLIRSTIRSGNNTIFHKIALVGAGTDSSKKTALYIRDNRDYCLLADSVKITGNTYIPFGIFRSYHSRDVSNIPDIYPSRDTLANIRNYPNLLDYLIELYSRVKAGRKYLADSLYNSFDNDPIKIIADTIVISAPITGNYCLAANTIIVNPHSRLSNTILIADRIYVGEGFSGSVQIFAKDSIYISQNSTFSYPTVIGLFPELEKQSYTETLENRPVIKIDENVSLTGEIIAYAQTENLANRTMIIIKKNCEINGGIYCSGLLDFKGNCKGVVLTNKFIENSNLIIQENLLFNCVINRLLLSPYFSFSKAFPETSGNKIIMWLK